MAQLQKIDSNVTGLAYSEEISLKVLAPENVRSWTPLEPNGYSDFGGQLTTIARNPINPSRQRKKGVVTDLEASGGFGTDWTQQNLQDPLQGFMFADARRKGEAYIDAAVATTDEFSLHNRRVTAAVPNAAGSGYAVGDFVTVAGTGAVSALLEISSVNGSGGVTGFTIRRAGAYNVDPTTTGNAVVTQTGTGSSATADLTLGNISTDFQVGDIVRTSGFANGANNGNHIVNTGALATNTELNVATTLVAETPASDTAARVVRVGHEADVDDIDVVATSGSNLPRLTSTTLDFTTLGLIPGEWIFVGGDGALEQFGTAANNGFARVFSIAANELVVDKTQSTWIDETSSGSRTIHLYFGRVLKNETGSLIKRRTYQLERTLGAPDDASTDLQAEYLPGSLPNEMSVNIPTAEKITADLSFISLDNEQVAAGSQKGGTRLSLVEADAFNTSSDFSRIKMATAPAAGNAAPTPLFAFVTELTLSINNNATPNKAVGVLGAFEVTAGTFTVGGSLTAYFSNVAAVQAVRDNADITLDFHIVKANAGISVDIPMIALGEGRASVEQDQPITLPLSMDAATGAKYDANFDHTLLMVFYDYLPTLADV
jgi:hypothetical protein